MSQLKYVNIKIGIESMRLETISHAYICINNYKKIFIKLSCVRRNKAAVLENNIMTRLLYILVKQIQIVDNNE